jgi:hypothetical protein
MGRWITQPTKQRLNSTSDIEDTLLALLMSRASNKKFSKLDVKRVYFGNWLRDYSQAVDVSNLTIDIRAHGRCLISAGRHPQDG